MPCFLKIKTSKRASRLSAPLPRLPVADPTICWLVYVSKTKDNQSEVLSLPQVTAIFLRPHCRWLAPVADV